VFIGDSFSWCTWCVVLIGVCWERLYAGGGGGV
jgi:hypothetical protein